MLTRRKRPTGSLDPIRERLRTDKGMMRKYGAEYLACSLLDIMVDRYFLVLEQMGDAAAARPARLLVRNGHYGDDNHRHVVHLPAQTVAGATLIFHPGTSARSLIPLAHHILHAPSSDTMHGPIGLRGVQAAPYSLHSFG